ncbi:MAG: hypothetical protein AAGB31_04955 [Bdellovibrio sp.]
MDAIKTNSRRIYLSTSLVCLALWSTACAPLSFSPVLKDQEESSSSTLIPVPGKTISSTEVVAYGNKQVDFLLVLDDSNSMLPELKKLAARLSTFVDSLEASNIDWQMCWTTTRGTSSNGVLSYGAPLAWHSYSPVAGVSNTLLKKGASNLNTIFTSTIDNMTIGGGTSGDERGLKATHENFATAASHPCYRTGAAISVIVISDEDERSVGGDPTKVKAKDSATAYQPLEAEDRPETILTKAQQVFGADVRFTFNSIIVQPGDTACEALQDQDTSPSHPGYLYAEMSKLTQGGLGSICDADYGSNLNTFKDKIVNSLSSLSLQCEPVKNSLTVSVGGIPVFGIKVEGKTLKFDYALVEGTQIDLSYDCDDE